MSSWNTKWIIYKVNQVFVVNRNQSNITILFGGYYTTMIFAKKQPCSTINKHCIYFKYSNALFLYPICYSIQSAERHDPFIQPVGEYSQFDSLSQSTKCPRCFAVSNFNWGFFLSICNMQLYVLFWFYFYNLNFATLWLCLICVHAWDFFCSNVEIICDALTP